jgi:RNA polymerase sigma-70 factor (ECF subfamily)
MHAEEKLTAAQEARLVQRARRGDPGAFEVLMLAHQRYAYNLALRGLGDPQEAEDLTQEAFLRAWQSLPRFRGQARFATWLYRIVVNLCYQRLPRLRREMQALSTDELPEPDRHPGQDSFPAPRSSDPAQAVEVRATLQFLYDQIEKLPETYRMIVLLRYVLELDYAEISEVLEIPMGTVKTALHRSRARLHASLATYESLST